MADERVEWRPDERKHSRQALKARRRRSYTGTSNPLTFDIAAEFVRWREDPGLEGAEIERGGLTQRDAQLAEQFVTKYCGWPRGSVSVHRRHHRSCGERGRCSQDCSYALVGQRDWRES